MSFTAAGAISGCVAVAAGAFGAHALKGRLTPEALQTFEVGVRYQLVHALALVLVGLLATRAPTTALAVAGWGFLAGTVLFSGSLYGLSLTGIRAFGPITPIGGMAFLAGWAALAVAGLRNA